MAIVPPHKKRNWKPAYSAYGGAAAKEYYWKGQLTLTRLFGTCIERPGKPSTPEPCESRELPALVQAIRKNGGE